MPNGNYVDFGAYGASTCKGLSVDNTGVASGLIYARDVFAVFARRPGMAQEGFTIFSHNSAAYWAGNPANNCLFASTPNTRADKGATRIDHSPAWGGRVKIKDNAWHLLSNRLPGIDVETGMNQIGFDRSLTAYSGGFLLAEVLVFDQRLSDFDRMRVEDYLWKKWMGARQTAVGDVAVAAGSTVTLASSSDVTATLSGGGSFAKFGTGIATLLDGGFGGAVELLSGSVRNEAIPFAVAEAGQTLTAGGQGIVARTAADAGVFAKAGSGQLVAVSLPQATEVRVTGGNFVLSPPSPSADFLAPADFPNAGFEDFGVPVSQNVGGVAGTATPQTYGNWTFDRVGRSGNALLMILNKTAQSRGTAGNTFNIFADDARGIGYKGTNYLYLCRGDATGELVANGGFESGAASWTFSGGAATASANSLWIENVANTPPQGADCAVIGGRGAASGAVAQDVAFPAAGRYELKFRIRRFRENPFTEDTKVSVFRAAVGGETIHMSYIQRNEDERVERPERRRSGMTGFKGTSTCSAEA